MSTIYGLTSNGFVAKPQQQIILEIQTSLQAAFGQNINLGAESNFGQLVGIFSEREALIWQLAEAVYSSQYPGGAEGTSVDNILALNSLRRLAATPTRTNSIPITQVNGITLYGLILFGTPGTVIPFNSIIQTNQSPPLQFKLDNDVTIGAAANAVQGLFLSNTPDSGAFQLSIIDAADNTILTPSIPWNALGGSSKISFASTPVSGQWKISLTIAGVTLTTGFLAFNATSGQVQAAIRLLAGYSAVNVSGSMGSGFQIDWLNIPNPTTAITSSSLGVASTVINSIQSSINNLHDVTAGNYPYTDVTVVPTAGGFTITFGGGSPYNTQPSSGSAPEALFTVIANTLMMTSNVTNINIVNEVQGHPAQGIGTATCTVTGPNFVAAKSLNTIGTSITGWTGVTNQLDCFTGTNVEDDTQALVRRTASLQAQANGPLASIIEKVSQLPNVIATVGFENLNEAALQLVLFSSIPGSGHFKLVVNGSLTPFIAFNATPAQVQTAIRTISGFSNALVTGDMVSGFTVDYNGSLGGQPQPLMVVTQNTTGVTITIAFGRPGKSFEIVVEGGADTTIAETIRDSKPAGIQSYGSTTVLVFDQFGNPYNISFSRPTEVPIYMLLTMVTDLTDNNPKFVPQSVAEIQQELVNIGNKVGIGGLIIGFGTEGLVGAFNNVLGIKSYTLYFGRTPNPVSNANIQMQPEEVPIFESFNIGVSYT